jgi:RHS repeat-associated protein
VEYVRASGNQKFVYAYDPGGRPLTLTYPVSTGIVAEFIGPTGQVGWDGNGQLKHLRYMKGTDTVRRFEFSYDDAGNRITQFDFSPTKATYWAYSYDWLDRLESVKKVETANTTILAQIQDLPAADALPLMGALQLVSVYSYDAADNRTEFQVPNLSDPALTETFRYSYDFADNITLIEKKIGSGSFSSLETFVSDFDGNMTSRTKGGVTTSYQWDDFNRLAAISTSDDSKKQSHTFGVNGFRRKKKDKNDVETTEYATGLATAVSKAQGGDTVTYLMGHRLMGFERSSDGAMFFFLTDSLSSVRDVVRGTDGAVMASYEFSEYGQRIASSESGVSSQKTFVGALSVQDEVADTGLMMMGHRFYDPGLLGRFLNRDPIGFRGGPNLFEYSRSSPAQFVDAAGLQWTNGTDVPPGYLQGHGSGPYTPPPSPGSFLIYAPNGFGPIDVQNLQTSIEMHNLSFHTTNVDPGFRGYQNGVVALELDYQPNGYSTDHGSLIMGRSRYGIAHIYGKSIREYIAKNKARGNCPSGVSERQLVTNVTTYSAKHEILYHHSGNFLLQTSLGGESRRFNIVDDMYALDGYLESNAPRDVLGNLPTMLSYLHPFVMQYITRW